MRYHNGSGPAALLVLGLLCSACRPWAAGPTPAPPTSSSPIATRGPSSPAPLPAAGFGVASPTATVAALPATSVPGRQATPPTLSPTSTPAPGQLRSLTLDDSGQTITFMVGERFLLNLGGGYDWTVEIGDPNLLGRVVDVPAIQGSQGWYEARQPGTTTLSATGDPPCRKVQPPCMAPSRLVQITMVVR